MALKKLTIMIMPDGIRGVRQYKIPKIFLHFLSMLIAASGIFLYITYSDYIHIRKQATDNEGVLRENRLLKAQLSAFAGKIDSIGSQMVELKKFDNKLKVMVNLEPSESEDSTPYLAIGGSDPALLDQGYSVEKAHQKLARLMHQTLDNLDTEVSIQAREKAGLFEFLESQKSMFACTPSVWPTRGWVSSRFGYRVSPFTNEREFHNGLDVSARTGSPVIAPADGVVEAVTKTYGYGNLLTINHGYGFKTRYAHLSKFLVKKGQTVKRGEKIALVGNTGRSTGPHLHYEVHLNGVPVDPLLYILN